MAGSGYGNALAGNDDDLYSDLFRTALLYFANRQGSGSGDTPNFYPVPLTPEQKRVEDEKWRVYKADGTPAQKMVAGLGQQFLSGLQSGPSNFKFLSPEMQGQSFAGGFKLPTFDLSKLPDLSEPTTPAPTKPAPPPGATNPLRTTPGNGLQRRTPWEYIGDPQTKFGAAWNGDNPGPSDDSGLLFGRDTVPGGMKYGDGPSLDGVRSWWSTFQRDHPDWAKLGPAAITAAMTAQFGFGGVLAGRFLKWLLGAGAPPTAPPPATGGGPTIPIGGAPGNIMKP